MSKITPVSRAAQAGIAHQFPRPLPAMKGIRKTPEPLLKNKDFKEILQGKTASEKLAGVSLKEFAKISVKKEKEEKEFKSAPSAKKVLDFFVRNPNPSDKKFHEFADSNKVNKHKAEALAYRLATKYTHLETGGKSNEKGAPKKHDARQMAMGEKVEKEHSKDKVTARKISADHLAEIPDYYDRLKKMEDQAAREGKKR